MQIESKVNACMHVDNSEFDNNISIFFPSKKINKYILVKKNII